MTQRWLVHDKVVWCMMCASCMTQSWLVPQWCLDYDRVGSRVGNSDVWRMTTVMSDA